MAVMASLPIFLEMVSERTYPIAEGISSGMMTILYNGIEALFLCVPFLPVTGITSEVLNWLLVASVALSLIPMFIYKEKYGRLVLDHSASTQAIATPT